MKSARMIASAGALALALTACGGNANSGGGGGSSGRPVDGKTFTLALASDPGNLDPHLTSLSGAYQVDKFLYDTLVRIDPDGKETAGLAREWKGTSTKATFTLRKGVTCSDGSALTARLVADNVNFVGDPKNGSSRVGVFVPAGAKATADAAAGTVTVTSPSPDAFLARNVGSLPIVCSKGMKDRSKLKRGGSGSGMFVLTEAVADDHYTLTRRKEYAWGPDDGKKGQKGLPDKVVIKIVQNQATASNLLLSGQINAVAITGPDKKRLSAHHLFERRRQASRGELWFNQKSGGPAADPAVRRALTRALDLGKLRKVMTNGTGQAPKGLVASDQGPCTQDTISGTLPAHDTAAAESALDAAGWKAGPGGTRQKDGKKLSLVFYSSSSYGPSMQTSAELLRDAWKSVGVEVTLKTMTDAQAGQIIVGGQGSWDATFLPLNVSLPSQIVPFVSGPTPPDGTDFSFIDNDDYNRHAKNAAGMPGAAGCAEWAAAEKALFQRADVVPFAVEVSPVFANGARFELSEGSIEPTSIRMVA